MKKIIFLAVIIIFLAGCSSMSQSGYAEHDTHYKNWDHMKFSLWGYRNPAPEDLTKAEEQGWWGLDVPYVPAQ
ncbi:MAG: membrane lipoprotein lipid attachment site-containing protein [Desulfobacteraceae bacterium]|nr:membrane lipoprotein lipid attachment site-containing protein [Desulfobacteraceae bacterium]